ncbi:hypothetical protein Q764_07120 [Flavobacterium suncheonense GH29-5 = DSM 17707]|uniref:Uncharacterized protein n=2 Tax=Flavobacterium suncheonense TaxID=350894 RepID=A0A0A2MDJ9_9FLAO|nr:hypothetical protein Q764_07120 [Flavobacterium suncheonense GH29-5 = DSM 17707]
MSAHVVNKTNKNYLSHTSVSDVINPTRVLSVGKIDEATYLSYTKLYQLSRRSRYLINEKVAQNKGGAPQPDIQPCNLTYSTHFRKAVSHLEVVMNFMAKEYALTFSKTDLKCVDLNGMAFNYFNVLA